MPVFPMQLHDLGSLMTKGLAGLELLHTLVGFWKELSGWGDIPKWEQGVYHLPGP